MKAEELTAHVVNEYKALCDYIVDYKEQEYVINGMKDDFTV